jgi:hypothetical protein
MDFLHLPDIIHENASFMALIRDACNLQTFRSAVRHQVAHRLHIAEMGENQNGSEVQALRKELEEAEEAFHQTLVMIDALKALVLQVSPQDTSSMSRWEGSRSINFDRASSYSSSSVGSNYSP